MMSEGFCMGGISLVFFNLPEKNPSKNPDTKSIANTRKALPSNFIPKIFTMMGCQFCPMKIEMSNKAIIISASFNFIGLGVSFFILLNF